MKSVTVGLIGNPNAGKTTVFNALTGARQKVGNWPGVTVERNMGIFRVQDTCVNVVDLPGLYSLVAVSETSSIDERIAADFILYRQADVVINVLDASHLERSLYLTMELLEMGVPVVVAVNMLDIARQRNITVSLEALAKHLGCPVIGLEANRNKGIATLKNTLVQPVSVPPSFHLPLDAVITDIITDITAKLPVEQRYHWVASRLLEGDVSVRRWVPDELLQQLPEYQAKISTALGEEADILLADARYRLIQSLIADCAVTTAAKKTLTSRIDSIVLHRVLGIPIFLAVMYSMFLFSVNVGGAFQDFFDQSSSALLVEGVTKGLVALHSPDWLIAILAQGVGKGINTTLTFIPVIGAMFFFLSLLEDSGYMTRAAFVIDRLMRTFGLPGKSFVPMIVGFGCNVPAVMGARTLENRRDRILTVMMSPFMSCGARLAIYAVFTAAFFPVGGQNIVFVLYLTGILIAMLTGFLLRHTLLKGEPAPLIMELPPYHWPSLKTMGWNAWQRLRSFVVRAGKLIVPLCVLLGLLSHISITGDMTAGESDANSILAMAGRAMTPLFAPMGIVQDNWPATVGLLTGVLAKEVVIGTLNALYVQVGHLAAVTTSEMSVWEGLQAAVATIPANLSQLGGALANPMLAQAPVTSLSDKVYGVMYQSFDGKIGAMAYLFFVLLYVPCVSTIAAIWRELHRGWALFSVCWSTAVAYGVAVSFYQLMTFGRHPLSSATWLLGLAAFFTVIIFSMRKANPWEEKAGGEYEFARH